MLPFASGVNRFFVSAKILFACVSVTAFSCREERLCSPSLSKSTTFSVS